MTPNEQTLLAKLLDMASDEFANHGCNDFPLPNTDENWALYVAMEQRLDPGGWKMEVVLSVNFQTAEVSILSTDGEPYINVKYHRETLTGFDPVASAEAAFLALGYTISGLWLLAQNLRVGANDPEEAPAMDIQVGIYEAPRKPPITVEDIAIYPSSVTTTPWVRWSVPNEPYATRTPIETFRKMIESEGYTFTGR
jgi:hypothetical protein